MEQRKCRRDEEGAGRQPPPAGEEQGAPGFTSFSANLLPPGGSWWPTVVMRPENWLALGMPCRALSPVAPLTHATQGWQARRRPCWVCKALDTAAGTGGHFASRVPPVRAGPGTLRHATVLLALRWFLVRRLPSHRPGMYAGIKLFPSPSFSGIAGTDRRNRNA